MHQLRTAESMALIIRQRREELKISQHEMADELRMHIFLLLVKPVSGIGIEL